MRVRIVAGRSGHIAPFARRLVAHGCTVSVLPVETGDADALRSVPHEMAGTLSPEPGTDVVMVLEDREDGARHLDLAEPYLSAGVPVFVDKPLATSWDDVLRLYQLAGAAGAPLMSVSAARYAEPVEELQGASAPAPTTLTLTGTGEVWFYGVHLAELAVAVLGPGFTELSATKDEHGMTARLRHRDGPVTTLVLEPADEVAEGFGVVARGPGLMRSWTLTDYAPWYDRLIDDVMTFARVRRSPVPAEDTLAVAGLLHALETAGAEPIPVPAQGVLP